MSYSSNNSGTTGTSDMEIEEEA